MLDRVENLPWVVPEALPGLLAEASCALCLAHGGIEHELAQRTRLLDLLSSGIPIVCTQGDALGARAVEAGAATAVPLAMPARRRGQSATCCATRTSGGRRLPRGAGSLQSWRPSERSLKRSPGWQRRRRTPCTRSRAVLAPPRLTPT